MATVPPKAVSQVKSIVAKQASQEQTQLPTPPPPSALKRPLIDLSFLTSTPRRPSIPGSVGPLTDAIATGPTWQGFLSGRDILDLSHVKVSSTVDRSVVDAAIALYGKMPGGIVVEGEARCDFPLRSLAIDPVSPSHLILNGTQYFDTGLSGEEVTLLWHAILQSDHVSRDFGVLSQNEAVGIENANIVALTMMKADNALGGIVYGYDSEFAVRRPDYSFYRNPFLDEISDATYAGALPQHCFNFLYERAARCFLRILDVRFQIATANAIKVSGTNVQAVIGFANGNDSVAASSTSDNNIAPTVEGCFPWVHLAFNHFADNFARYASLEPYLARVIAYAEVVLLLRRAKAANVLLLGHDDISRILSRRQQVVLPSFNFSIRSDEFVRRTSDIARYLARRTDANTFECFASALVGLRFANLAGDFDSFMTCKKAAHDCITGLYRKPPEAHAPAHHHELHRLLASALDKVSNLSHDVLIGNCIGDALQTNRTWEQRNASLQAARRLCGTDAMLAKNPATRCFWIEINSHTDPSFDPLPDFAQARTDDPFLQLPYASLQRITFANRVDCPRQYTRDEVLQAIARIKYFAATPSQAPTEAWATLHGYAEQEILRLAHSKKTSAASTERLSLTDIVLRASDQSTLYEVIRRCAERLSTLPSTAFVTRLLHHNSPFVASHQLLDLETSGGLSNFFDGIRPQVEHFDSNASQLWWKQLLRDFAAPSETGVSKLGVLLAHELHARRLTVGWLYEKMIEMHTANPQAALLMFDVNTATVA